MIFSRLRAAWRYVDERDEVVDLAFEAEALARDLNALEPPEPLSERDRRRADVCEVLRTTCRLLEAAAPGEPAPDDEAEPEPEAEPEWAAAVEKPEPVPEPASAVPEEIELDAIQELIAMRDMVLIPADGSGATQIQDALGRKLKRVIEKHGVRVLDATGAFDERVHTQLDVRSTDDPAQDEIVCETIRPGYVIGERVIRPQEVAVYQYES